jgi:hypothetical protein
MWLLQENKWPLQENQWLLLEKKHAAANEHMAANSLLQDNM